MKTRIIFLFMIIICCLAVCPNIAQTQGEMNDEAYSEYRMREHEMDSVYNKIMELYNEDYDDSVFCIKLETAQKAWIVFRDAHIASIFPVEEHMYYGSMYPMCYYYTLADITKKRTAELKTWLEGFPEGEACGGSVKFKRELYVIFDSTYANVLTRQCSRENLKIEGCWSPAEKDISSLESNFNKIYEIKDEQSGRKIDDTKIFCRQYVGIIINDVKLIYINALPYSYDLNIDNSSCNWRREPCRVCDGGAAYWGAVYNPATEEFSHLSFNGEG